MKGVLGVLKTPEIIIPSFWTRCSFFTSLLLAGI